MPLVTDIRRALTDALPYLAPRVAPAAAEYADRGLDTLRFTVTVLVGEDTPDNQDRLDALLDPDAHDGVRRLLEHDRTLSGLVAYLTVSKSSGYQLHPQGEDRPPALGATWTVACTTDS